MTRPVLGLLVPSADEAVAREFFEFFKTPWEPVRRGQRYSAVLTTHAMPEDVDAGLVLAYGAREHALDGLVGARPRPNQHGPSIVLDERAVPLYGSSCTFTLPAGCNPEYESLGYQADLAGRRCHRIGYDLFSEVRHLMTSGQPVAAAAVPSLDLHVDHIRRILRRYEVPFAEVLPRPSSAPFICCLTHDVDFYGMRRHGLDRSIGGFALRATVGSLWDGIKGRRTGAECARNFIAALLLPFVMMRLAHDRWRVFASYAEADGARPSTFFVIPRRNHAGTSPSGEPQPGRAVKHEAADARSDLATVVATGSEVALHGLDAWREQRIASDERQRVATAADRPVRGVRMHWLYGDQATCQVLDAAGFDYDSTCGYNEAVGYRAGTALPFQPPGCARLMELPLHVMDSSMFFPDRLGLTQEEGIAKCLPLVAHAAATGGVVTVNWHDRSLEPERQWNRAYAALLDALDAEGPWYATAGAAVDWFRWRRDIRFQCQPDASLTVTAPALPEGVPEGVLRVHRADGVPEDRVIAGSDVMTVAS